MGGYPEDWTLIDTVNMIVKESFGKDFDGNTIMFEDFVGEGNFISKNTSPNTLRDLVKHGFFKKDYRIGEFLKKENGQYDGSKLLVDSKYQQQAEKYSTLYEKHFNIKPEIKFTNTLAPCVQRNYNKN